MPYSKSANFQHNRQKHPAKFESDTLRTVPLSHTEYSGKKFNKKGAKAVVGRLKKQFRPKSGKKYAIQSILIPKKK